jgi:hypothetical protein
VSELDHNHIAASSVSIYQTIRVDCVGPNGRMEPSNERLDGVVTAVVHIARSQSGLVWTGSPLGLRPLSINH